jgi:hypothetical protein
VAKRIGLRAQLPILEPAHSLVVAYLTLALVVAMVSAVLLFLPDMAAMYYQGPGSRALRHRLGFELEIASVSVLGSPRLVWQFANLRSGGLMAAAGVQDGDTLVQEVFPRCGLDTRPSIIRIFDQIECARRQLCVLEVIHTSQLQGEWWQHVRTARLKPG